MLAVNGCASSSSNPACCFCGIWTPAGRGNGGRHVRALTGLGMLICLCEGTVLAYDTGELQSHPVGMAAIVLVSPGPPSYSQRVEAVMYQGDPNSLRLIEGQQDVSGLVWLLLPRSS